MLTAGLKNKSKHKEGGNMVNNKNPRFVGAKQGHTYNQQSNFNRKKYKPTLDRTLIPKPIPYYSKQFPNLKVKGKWANLRCCFHSPDSTPSLSINMIDGHFICHACNVKGCDVIDFHQLRYGMNFIEVVTYFGAWKHE